MHPALLMHDALLMHPALLMLPALLMHPALLMVAGEGGGWPPHAPMSHGCTHDWCPPMTDPRRPTTLQTLARENRRDYGRILLELWVNQVLDPGSVDLSGRVDPLKFDPSILKVLAPAQTQICFYYISYDLFIYCLWVFYYPPCLVYPSILKVPKNMFAYTFIMFLCDLFIIPPLFFSPLHPQGPRQLRADAHRAAGGRPVE